MKKSTLYAIATVAAGALLLTKKKCLSGVGKLDEIGERYYAALICYRVFSSSVLTSIIYKHYRDHIKTRMNTARIKIKNELELMIREGMIKVGEHPGNIKNALSVLDYASRRMLYYCTRLEAGASREYLKQEANQEMIAFF